MEKIIDWHLPIKTVSEANCSEHWTKKHKRHKAQKNAIWLNFHAGPDIRINLPCHVKLTRISPRLLDTHDNLPMSFKWIFDSICDNILPGFKPGLADNHPDITIEYDQEKGKPQAVKIEIFS